MISCDSRNIAARFVAHALRSPEDLAIVDESAALTYGWLLRHAYALAHTLRLEHAPGSVVAIHGQRKRDTPLAMIACLLANVTFVVIDAAYQQQRILDILRISRATTILHAGLDEDLGSAVTAQGVVPCPIHCAETVAAEALDVGAQETAYLLFTSGSTGFPKGIRTGHAPLIHFIEWYRRAFQPGYGSRFSMLAGLSHDPLFRDIFVPLSTGGQLHIPCQADLLNSDRLFAWMDRSEIEFAHLTPQLIDILHFRRNRERSLNSLKFVFCGGDVLRAETARQVSGLATRACLVNFYGTSETPQAMAYQVIGPDMDAPYPLGRPIADVEIEILSEEHTALGTGEQGEIAIVTEYLSDGYIDDATARAAGTRQSYVTRPAGAGKPAQKMYLTGDLGYKDAHGRLFFNGRRDDQVKIRGYRVDCAEVAAAIERHRLADKALVLPERTRSGDTALVAFVVGDAERVKRKLPALLPTHMMPAAVMAIPRLPLLPNGKTDRAALLVLRRAQLEQAHALSTPHAGAFFQALADSLDLADVDPDKSFVDMGGDSLSFIRTGFVIEDHIGYLPEGWESMPFSALAMLERHEDPPARLPALRTRQIEPSILLRAIAIVLVVLVHAKIGFHTVATSTLFVIAGMSFARFLLPDLLKSGSFSPTGRFVLKYAVPAGLWQAASGIHQGQFWLPDVLLFGTLWANPVQHLTFWFLDILTASILMIAALAWLAARSPYANPASAGAHAGFRFSITVLAVAITAFLLQTQLDWWNGIVGVTSVGPFRWFWLLALGAAIQTARDRLDSLLVSAIALVLAILCYSNLVTKGAYQEPFSLFMLVSIAVLIWVRHIPVPALAYRPILVLAQHSLFIYLFSLWVPNHLAPSLLRFGFPDLAALRIVLALAIGIGASMLWNRFLACATSRLRKAQPDIVRST